jgi:hypothetical protein
VMMKKIHVLEPDVTRGPPVLFVNRI